MNLVFAIDANYGDGLAVTLYSVLTNLLTPRSVHVYVLTADDIGDLPSKIDSVTRLIAHGVSVQWIAVDPNVLSRFKPSECCPHVSTSAYLRLFLPRLLPATVKRALYLDCDLLVLDDIGGLYDFDLRGKTVGATTDWWKTVGEVKLPDYQNMGFTGDEPYFNSGVMLIDMERFTDLRICERAVEYVIQQGGVVPYNEQDALNAVLRDEWHDFGNRWNVQGGMWVDREYVSSSTKTTGEHVALIHFTGVFKPWIPECDAPYVDKWRGMRADMEAWKFPTQYRLGCNARTYDPRVPHMSAVVGRSRLQPIPDMLDWTTKITSPYGMMCNDILANSICAAYYHARQIWSANIGCQITEPDTNVRLLYKLACGWSGNMSDEGPGGCAQGVLAYLLNVGAPVGANGNKVQKLSAYFEIDPRSRNDIMRAINSCGVVYAGLRLPSSVVPVGGEPPSTWFCIPGDSDVIGGHTVILVGYDNLRVDCISWGKKYRLTWKFVEEFADELYAMVDPDWFAAGGSQCLGLSRPDIEAQMDAVKNIPSV